MAQRDPGGGLCGLGVGTTELPCRMRRRGQCRRLGRGECNGQRLVLGGALGLRLLLEYGHCLSKGTGHFRWGLAPGLWSLKEPPGTGSVPLHGKPCVSVIHVSPAVGALCPHPLTHGGEQAAGCTRRCPGGARPPQESRQRRGGCGRSDGGCGPGPGAQCGGPQLWPRHLGLLSLGWHTLMGLGWTPPSPA